jgi:hypothetical protein
MVSVLLSAVSFPSAALPPELTVILRALAAVLVVVTGALAACVKPPAPAVKEIVPGDVTPVLLPRPMVPAAMLTLPTTVTGAVAICTLLVVRLKLPEMPAADVPFRVVVPVPAVCVRSPSSRTVPVNVTLAADAMVSETGADVPPMVPSVTLPAAAVIVAEEGSVQSAGGQMRRRSC